MERDNPTYEDFEIYVNRAGMRERSGHWKTPDVFQEPDLLHAHVEAKMDLTTELQTTGMSETRQFVLKNYPMHCIHNVHMCVEGDNPEMISYTRSVADGVRDRQVRVKLGRYLTKYFSDKLSEEKIRALVEQHNANCSTHQKWHIARTRGQIRTVYERGPSSCMSKPADHYATNRIHPCEMYAAGDLGVAFMWIKKHGRMHITARALVWPDKKQCGRIYGDVSRFRPILEEAGYEFDYDDGGLGFDGAKLLTLENNNCQVIAPYFDGPYGVDLLRGKSSGGFALMTRTSNATHHAREQNGLLSGFGEPCTSCGEDTSEDNQHHDANGEMICEHCYDNYYFTCDDDGEIYHDDDMHTTHDDRFIGPNAVDDYTYCDDTDQLWPSDQMLVTHDGRSISPDAASEDYFTCDDCGEIFPNEQANQCDHTGEIRCDACHEAYQNENPELFEEDEDEQEAA